MSDPYSILGVSPNASNDEIKKAYRKKCRMYHPDANIDNPNKAQLEEKFKEVGEAYRIIMEERSGKTSSYGYSDTSSTSDSRLNAAAAYIQRGYFREAINTLNSITDRNAMWYYLSAIANARVGNNIIAREHAKTASYMEPGNSTYRNLAASLNGEGAFYQDYRTKGTNYGRQFDFDINHCVRCCAINAALNLCCNIRCCYC